MGGWVAYILQNLAATSLVAAGWDSVEYSGSTDTIWLVDADQAVALN